MSYLCEVALDTHKQSLTCLIQSWIHILTNVNASHNLDIIGCPTVKEPFIGALFVQAALEMSDLHVAPAISNIKLHNCLNLPQQLPNVDKKCSATKLQHRSGDNHVPARPPSCVCVFLFLLCRSKMCSWRERGFACVRERMGRTKAERRIRLTGPCVCQPLLWEDLVLERENSST